MSPFRLINAVKRISKITSTLFLYFSCTTDNILLGLTHGHYMSVRANTIYSYIWRFKG
jgi:hypothetical protein